MTVNVLFLYNIGMADLALPNRIMSLIVKMFCVWRKVCELINNDFTILFFCFRVDRSINAILFECAQLNRTL